MAVRTYRHETQTFDPDTGEITLDSKHVVSAVDNEADYIKVYRYLNTVFAFKNIDKKYVPTLMEICNYMTYADKGQEVQLTKYVKEKISAALHIGIPEIAKHIAALKKADVLRPVARGVYAVNPFIIGRGKWTDIKELRAQFDFDTGLMSTQSVTTDRITGKTIAMITSEEQKRKKAPEQLSLFDYMDTTREKMIEQGYYSDNPPGNPTS